MYAIHDIGMAFFLQTGHSLDFMVNIFKMEFF
jgi:hypothetical protein